MNTSNNEKTIEKLTLNEEILVGVLRHFDFLRGGKSPEPDIQDGIRCGMIHLLFQKTEKTNEKAAQ